MLSIMAGVRRHALAIAVVACCIVAAGLFLTIWRPRYHPEAAKTVNDPVAYTRVAFTAADAKRAFGAVGIRLLSRSHQPGIYTDLSTADYVLAVDVFGDPARVNAIAGSFVGTIDIHNNYVRYPTACRAGIPDAARWRENVRVTVRCSVGGEHEELLRSASRALARL